MEDYEWNHLHYWDFGYFEWYNFNEAAKNVWTPENDAYNAFAGFNAVYDYGRLGFGDLACGDGVNCPLPMHDGNDYDPYEWPTFDNAEP